MQPIIIVLIATALIYLLWRKHQSSQRAARRAPYRLFRDILPLLDNESLEPGATLGSWKWTGLYRGEFFQLQTVPDTLAIRKLPSLWLMVTLPNLQNITHTLDLMMRPAGPTTFSNFDFLPHTLPTPTGFPEAAVIRSDRNSPADLEFLRSHLSLFHTGRGKELLVSPKGLRIVLLGAEADRARYGVLREANFGDRVIAAEPVHSAMDTLLNLQAALNG